MNKKKLSFVVIAGLLVIVGALFLKSSTVDQSSDTKKTAKTFQVAPLTAMVGQTAPDFDFETVDNKTVKLSSLRGKPVIMSFVLTRGCTPCATTAKATKQVQDQTAVQVIQVALDPSDPISSLRAFRSQLGAPDWLMGYDKNSQLSDLYRVRTVDTKFVIDAKGKIIYRDNGATIEADNLLKIVKGQAS